MTRICGCTSSLTLGLLVIHRQVQRPRKEQLRRHQVDHLSLCSQHMSLVFVCSFISTLLAFADL
eukprot:m.357629 g.357629  ORF g.357629 m.357629 type:complete len:64 (+) comp17887_c0_seq1:1893-2084(+)